MVAWKKQEVDAARLCQERKETTRLGKLGSYSEG